VTNPRPIPGLKANELNEEIRKELALEPLQLDLRVFERRLALRALRDDGRDYLGLTGAAIDAAIREEVGRPPRDRPLRVPDCRALLRGLREREIDVDAIERSDPLLPRSWSAVDPDCPFGLPQGLSPRDIQEAVKEADTLLEVQRSLRCSREPLREALARLHLGDRLRPISPSDLVARANVMGDSDD